MRSIQLTLKKTAGFYHFKERITKSLKDADVICLDFSEGGTLLLNGTHSVLSENGVFKLLPSRLREGENTLSYVNGKNAFLTEGVLLKDGTLSPSGLMKEAYLVALMNEVERIAEREEKASHEIHSLKEKTKERALFS